MGGMILGHKTNDQIRRYFFCQPFQDLFAMGQIIGQHQVPHEHSPARYAAGTHLQIAYLAMHFPDGGESVAAVIFCPGVFQGGGVIGVLEVR